MYVDRKEVKDNRIPVYLSAHTTEKLLRIMQLQGGQKGARAREAMERGIDVWLHELESQASPKTLRGLNQSHVCA